MRRVALITSQAEGLHLASPVASGAVRAALLMGRPIELLVVGEPTVAAPVTVTWERLRQAGLSTHFLLRRGSPAARSVFAEEWVREHRPDVALFVDAEGLADATLTAREAGLLSPDLAIGLLVLDPIRRRWEQGGQAGADGLAMMAMGLEDVAACRADFLVFADAETEAWFGRTHPRTLALPRLLLDGLPLAPDPAEGEAELVIEAFEPTAAPRVAGLLRCLEEGGIEPLTRLMLPSESHGPCPIAALLREFVPLRLRLGTGSPIPDATQPRRWPAGSVALQATSAAGVSIWDMPCAQLVRLASDEAGAVREAAREVRAALGRRSPPRDRAAQAARLRSFVQQAASRLVVPPEASRRPLVSVCISHFDRPKLLRQALDSLAAQSWPRLEVVLVDDASPSAAAREALDSWQAEFAASGWQMLRNGRELWQAAGRNRAVAAARGEFVLIMDDDNLAEPEEIETMARALLASGADAVGALQNLFRDGEDPHRPGRPPHVAFFPTGGPAALGVIWNIFGDVNVMFRRERFLSLGGYTDEPELGCEDYEIAAALARAGGRMMILPRALYAYRYSEVNMARGMSNERLYLSHLRPLRPLREGLVHGGARLLRLAHGIEHSRQQMRGESYWRAASRPRPLRSLGLGPLPRGEAFRAKLAALAALSGAQGAAEALAADLDHPAAARLVQRFARRRRQLELA
jgi:GT2 family glycosyltransferase